MSDVVLGVHLSAPPGASYTADGNAALLVRGVPVVAVAQERVTRRKYDGGFAEAARYCLDAAGLTISDVDVVAVSTFARPDVACAPENAEAAAHVERTLGSGPRVDVVASHHIAHAAAAAAQCPFDRALVAVIDNEGSVIGSLGAAPLWAHPLERSSYYLLDGDDLRLVARDHDGPGEVGYGKTYSKVTRYAGFAGYQESGKTMALAAFGDPSRYARIPLFRVGDDRRVRTALHNSEDGLADLARLFVENDDPLPSPRRSGERFDPAHLDLAAWCQTGLEESVGSRIAGLAADHAVTAVCGAGGVFLNSVMNRSLQVRLQSPDVFVPPSPADAGLALGAAAWSTWRSTGVRPRWNPNPYLGSSHDGATIAAALAGAADLKACRVPDPVAAAVADLRAGRIIGWFQGASEYGPRALGNRSILAAPSDPWARELLNNRVKHREWFRPYAPVSTECRADDIFELAGPVPFMMHVAAVKRARVQEIPGGVHVDGSARLQTVSPDQNPMFHDLVDRFTRTTGVPAVLNTSLNVDGMPIVETPTDAVECLRRAPGMHALHIGGYRVTRIGTEK